MQRPDHLVFQSLITNGNHIFPARVPIATKPGRMVTQFDGLLPIKSL